MKLTDNQKKDILKLWNESDDKNPPSIEQLLNAAYPDQKLDGRTKEGKLVKAFLGEKGVKPRTKTVYTKKGFLELTDDQKEYIRNNSNMKSDEIARVLFSNQHLTAQSQEARSVYHFQKDLIKGGVLIRNDEEEAAGKQYSPPKSLEKTCYRINKYIKGLDLDSKNLKPTQKKQINAVISYLHAYRFVKQMNDYSKINDRDLFESTFIGYVYDKVDLTREDLDKTVLLATEAVISSNKLKTIDMLQREQDRSVEEDGRISMALVEAIGKATSEYNASVKRQRDLYNELTNKRSERLKDRLGDTASILNLIEMWKNEETRLKMLHLAIKRKEKIENEIDRLDSMEDMIAMVAGLDKNEALNG